MESLPQSQIAGRHGIESLKGTDASAVRLLMETKSGTTVDFGTIRLSKAVPTN
jgi:hypothetical protein